jgi:hypothetical protein
MSKIEVDAITEQSGSTLTAGGGAGKTVVVDATTVTLGRCGGTVALASGASQTGFGRTGTVDWQTTPKTATFTAVNGEGYFCNTTSGTFEVDLPAGVAGAIVSIQDYNNTFDSNNLTVDPNGSEKINGGEAGGFITLSTEGLGITFVYIDATVGWRSVQSNEYSTSGINPAFICASVSGACNTLATVDTNFKVATFTGPGTFTVNSVGNPAGSTTVDYLVIAGGGGGANKTSPANTGEAGAGGGAGGYRESSGIASGSYTVSTLGACVSALPVSVQGYPIIIGGGGTTSIICGSNSSTRSGSNSSALGITSTGGGGGGARSFTTPIDLAQGASGGSGGGGTYIGPTGTGAPGGTGNTPPVSPPQGNAGGNGPGPAGACAGAAGGGATAVGTGIPTPGTGGIGGAGATSSINGTPTGRAGGGGGGANTVAGAASDGGGAGANRPSSVADNGVDNKGGGGGGGSGGGCAPGPGGVGQGGSGIVIIRYKFQ